jgi:hypothetical protein
MSKPYDPQLIAIQSMLANSNPEIVQEAWSQLFKLWLKLTDSSDINQDIILIALVYKNLVKEFESRINVLSTRDSITDFFLRNRLRNLASEIAQARSNTLKKNETSVEGKRSKSSKSQKTVSESSNKKRKLHTKKVFISYSHKDEKYKDELVNILTPLQDEGIIVIWQDREIDPGDDWYQAIQDAMNTCNLALLLISADFLTSRFIQDEELARLLERRKKKGLRVVPIIIRPCMWQIKSVLKDIQALPKDGKPVSMLIDRDQAWTEVGMAIADIAK